MDNTIVKSVNVSIGWDIDGWIKYVDDLIRQCRSGELSETEALHLVQLNAGMFVGIRSITDTASLPNGR